MSAGAATWFLAGERMGGGEEAATTTSAPQRLVTAGELAALPGVLGRPVYWVGPRGGVAYELSRRSDGRVYVRYLPSGTVAGDPRATFLTVATYPQADAFARLRQTASTGGRSAVPLPGGGIGVVNEEHATSVHLAYPGVEAQVEVFDATPDAALRLAQAGEVLPIGATARAVGPRHATRTELHTLADRLQRPVFWAGPRPGRAYELTVTPEARVYVRYLPRGIPAGSPDAHYLAVATYPSVDAFRQIRDAGGEAGNVAVDVPGGGVGVFAKAQPRNVYVAFSDAPVQVEVFHPTVGEALRLVLAGRITGA